MGKNEVFEVNLERFSRFCPLISLKIEELDNSSISFCKTQQNEINLEKSYDGQTYFYHLQEGALDEAKLHFETLFILFPQFEVIFFYGLGLGYLYDAAKVWLKQDRQRFLVFLEDDLEVIHRFLETTRATEILSDPQVIVQGFDRPKDTSWNEFRKSFHWIFEAFASKNYAISSLEMYNVQQAEHAFKVNLQIQWQLAECAWRSYEIQTHSKEVFQSFYQNILQMKIAKLACDMYGKFNDIPAVICGAGPSLALQLSLLREINDKALIFGSGSAINALNQHGIEPHFAGALDSSPTQLSRILTASSFEMPYFFSPRFFHKAFLEIHGSKLYTKNSDLFPTFAWFEEKLGFSRGSMVHSGSTTTGFCLDIARELGCKPLIFVGMDLAYTEETRYIRELRIHPLDDEIEKSKLENLSGKLKVQDIHGHETFTNWLWAQEAGEYAGFATSYPGLLINATEAGMPIVNVPNIPFKKVIEECFSNQYDILNLIHVAIQNSSEPLLTDEKPREVVKEWIQSLQRCADHCEKILDYFQTIKTIVKNESELPILYGGKYALMETELHEELAYIHFLKMTDQFIQQQLRLDHYCIQYHYDLFNIYQKTNKLADIEISRYQFLKETLQTHITMANKALISLDQETFPSFSTQSQLFSRQESPEIYSFEQNELTIIDKELNLHYQKHFYPRLVDKASQPIPGQSLEEPIGELFFEKASKIDGQYLYFYPSGQLKGELFYDEGILHGPSSFYSVKENLLARSWFIKGLREGKTWQYYDSGELYSLQRFRGGLKQGKQEFYYRDGSPSIIKFYKEGMLDGTTTLFFQNGVKRREYQFSMGKLEGYEKVWNAHGQLVMEAFYHNNQPIDRAQSWHSNGQLAKQITFRDSSEHFDFFEWDEEGNLIKQQHMAPEPPLDEMIKKARELSSALDQLKSKFKEIQ